MKTKVSTNAQRNAVCQSAFHDFRRYLLVTHWLCVLDILCDHKYLHFTRDPLCSDDQFEAQCTAAHFVCKHMAHSHSSPIRHPRMSEPSMPPKRETQRQSVIIWAPASTTTHEAVTGEKSDTPVSFARQSGVYHRTPDWSLIALSHLTL